MIGYEHTSVIVEYTSDVDYRVPLHKRVSDIEQQVTLFKSGQVLVDTTANPYDILDTGEYDTIDVLYVENVDTGIAVDVTWDDGTGEKTARLEAGDRFYTETINAASRIYVTSTTSSAGIYYYASGDVPLA